MSTLSQAQANELAVLLQEEVPFVEEPFAALGEKLGVTEGAVCTQLTTWLKDGKLREISAVLEGEVLGYESALVAARVPEARLEKVAEIINQHPTVTHNYTREHAYNLWFTIAVPRTMGLGPSLEALSAIIGLDLAPLHKTITFKIGVRFDLQSRTNSLTSSLPAPPHTSLSFTPREQLLLRALQMPLPIVPAPFAALAQSGGVEVGELLAFAKRHKGGAIRRYVGTFRHRKLGVHGNSMVVWAVAPERIVQVGEMLARAPEVTHCYGRTTLPDFPYNLYSMVHGPDRKSCLAVAERLAEQVGVSRYVPLFSNRELKKTRLRYFLPELDTWWQANGKHGRSSDERSCELCGGGPR